MTKIIGLDVSFWQDYNGTPQQIDFNKAVTNGANFVFIRGSQNLDIDPDFEYNQYEAKKAGLLRGAYHFLDYRGSATDQARFFASLYNGRDFELPGVLDFEQHRRWPLPPRRDTIIKLELFVKMV